jgi:hypothetical protein
MIAIGSPIRLVDVIQAPLGGVPGLPTWTVEVDGALGTGPTLEAAVLAAVRAASSADAPPTGGRA